MSTEPDQQNTNSMSDGRLEVLGIVSSFHIAQLQVGLSKPIRLGQASTVKVCIFLSSERPQHTSHFGLFHQIVMRQSFPVQADGEPWLQTPAEFTITHSGQAQMLKNTSI